MEKMIFHLFMLFITSGLWLVALAVVLAYKMVTMGPSEQIVIDGQTFKVYGKDAGDFIKTITGGEES